MVQLPVTATLARFVASTGYADIPPDVCGRAKQSLADFIGVALAGSKEPIGTSLLAMAREMAVAPEATLIGVNDQTSRFWAAVINGTIAHTLELDDGHILAHTHPGVTTIPAALATAEKQKASGSELIAAIVLGYEVNIRVGDAVTPEAQYDRGFHAGGAVGSLGAAAAVGHLLGFDWKSVAGAIGNCCLGPLAPMEPFRSGAMVKDFYGGWPAATGLWAALLAERGVFGPDNFLEGPRGMLNCLSGHWDADGIVEGLGDRWSIMGTYTKKHAACSLAHTAIDSTLELQSQLTRPISEIDSIEVRTHVFAHELNEQSPSTAQGAKFSLPFVVACALLRGCVSLEEFSPAALRNPGIMALAKKVTVKLDDEFTRVHLDHEDQRPSKVTIRFHDGEVLEGRRVIARGWPEAPLTDEEFRKKYTALSGQAVSPSRGDEIWQVVQNLDALDDVSDLASLLGRESG